MAADDAAHRVRRLHVQVDRQRADRPHLGDLAQGQVRGHVDGRGAELLQHAGRRAGSTARARPTPSRRSRPAAARRPASRLTSCEQAGVGDQETADALLGRAQDVVDRVPQLPGAAQPAGEHAAVGGGGRAADVPLLPRADEQRDLDAVVGGDPGHLGQLSLGVQHRAAALGDPVDRDAACGRLGRRRRAAPPAPRSSGSRSRKCAPSGNRAWLAGAAGSAVRPRPASTPAPVSARACDPSVTCRPPVQRGAAAAAPSSGSSRPARRAGHWRELAVAGHQVGVLRLRAARQARVPGDRVTGRDRLAGTSASWPGRAPARTRAGRSRSGRPGSDRPTPPGAPARAYAASSARSAVAVTWRPDGRPTGRRPRWPAPGGAGRGRPDRAGQPARTGWPPRAGRPRRATTTAITRRRTGTPTAIGCRYRSSRSSPPTISTGASAPVASSWAAQRA